MIRVLRPSASREVEEALSKRGNDDKTELERAREYYRADPAPRKAFSFERYKEASVRHALDEYFHEKCAYCESIYSAVDANDIEHYRPKGGVTGCPEHPGYWWLAAVWQNLLPSCQACNRRRYRVFFEPGMTFDDFERARRERPDRLSGKANFFPVRDDNWVTTENDDISVEDPLLINPCERNPADHLEFVFDWDRSLYIWETKKIAALVRAKLKAGEPDEYGKASIETYGLNRAGLIRARTRHLNILQGYCRLIVDLIQKLIDPPPAEELAIIKKNVTSHKAFLTDWTKADQTYAAMAQAFVRQFAEELDRLAINSRRSGAT